MYGISISEIWMALIVWIIIGAIMTFIVHPRVLIQWIGKLYNNAEWVKRHLGAVHTQICAMIVKSLQEELITIETNITNNITETIIIQIKDIVIPDLIANFTLNDEVVTNLEDKLEETFKKSMRTFKANISNQVQAEFRHKENEVRETLSDEFISNIKEGDPLADLRNEIISDAEDKYPLAKYISFLPEIKQYMNSSNNGKPKIDNQYTNAW